ncbi:MAG: glycosyltransferase [Acidobacteria bacterium]|nr:glycosyltransferase [Acidobacteriota bacterium]
MPDVSIILPAYNEAPVIASVLERIRAVAPPGDTWEILVVDDGSDDGTGDAAEAAGARVVRHPYNKGNGAAVKSGLRAARGEKICLLDADGQHDPGEIQRLLDRLGDHDLIIGYRSGGAGGGWTRWFGNWFYNRLASYLARRPILDVTSGFRAARLAPMAEFIPLYPNGFSYPITSTLALIKAGYNVDFEPINVSKRVGKSKIRIIRDGSRFVMIALRIVSLFSPLRIFLPIAASLFAAGAGYGVYTIFDESRVTNTSVLFCLSALIIFLIGLVSEQIALMRFERRG